MNWNVDNGFCPKCGALMRDGICQSCEFSINVDQYHNTEKYSATPIPSMEMPLMEQTPRKKKAGIIVGIIIAIVCFILVIVIVAIIAIYVVLNTNTRMEKQPDIVTPKEDEDYNSINPDIEIPALDEEVWDDIWDDFDKTTEDELIDVDGDGIGELEYESGTEGLNAEYYPLITDYIRYDLSYSVHFDKYEDSEQNIKCTFPVVEGEKEYISYLNQMFYMFAKETESVVKTYQCTAISDAYVTYMDEDVMSVVFIEVYSFADESTFECVYCYNINMQNGELIKYGLKDNSDNVIGEMKNRCLEQSTSDAEYLFTQYSKEEIRAILANTKNSFVAFYTPLGMELGLNYGGYWCCATFKDYKEYVTVVKNEEETAF